MKLWLDGPTVPYLESGVAALLHRWLGMIEPHLMGMPVVAFAMGDSEGTSFVFWIEGICRNVMIESTLIYIHVGDELEVPSIGLSSLRNDPVWSCHIYISHYPL